MSVNLVWDDSQYTTLRFDYEGEWTWNEWYAAMEEAENRMHAQNALMEFLFNQ